MKRLLIVLLAAMPLFAQQQAAKSDGQKPVAIVNGEVITADKLDAMYERLAPEMRAQYAINGGKGALLDNYIRKRLLIQEAARSGFDKRASVKADIETARESALFDRYVRDVVASVIVNEAAMKNYYEYHQNQFTEPEMVKLRNIMIASTSSGPRPHAPEQARDIAKKAFTDVILAIPRTADPSVDAAKRVATFAKLARAYSEDRAGPSGGDLGWLSRAQLDPDVANVAFSIHPGIPSGIIETKNGFFIIFVEAKRAAGTLSFDEAKPRIRELMLQEHAEDVVEAVNRLTTALGDKGKIAIYPENIR